MTMITVKYVTYICYTLIFALCFINFLNSIFYYKNFYPDNIFMPQFQSNNSIIERISIKRQIKSQYESVLVDRSMKVNMVNIKIGSINRILPIWQQFLNATKSVDEFDEMKNYYLVGIVQLRVYAEDKAEMKVWEVKQWLHYMFLAGVEHIFLCDHFQHPSEQIKELISKYIYYDLVTYIPWNQTKNPMASQIRCYQKIMNIYMNHHVWHIAFDIDEYPFSFFDHNELFLQRYLQSLPENVSQVCVENFIILGKSKNHESLLINRFIDMTSSPPNQLTKPIYRPQRISKIRIHCNFMKSGSTLHADVQKLRMLHYWGDRAKDKDEGGLMNKTIKLREMGRVWTKRLEDSLALFGEEGSLL